MRESRPARAGFARCAGCRALSGGVATSILRDLHLSFTYFENISVVGYLLGAAASVIAGLLDRYGRANIVTVGTGGSSGCCACSGCPAPTPSSPSR